VKKEETVVRNLDKIFSATLRISNRKGFQAMSMRDLSRESGLSMGALYSYFSSKEELLCMLQHHGMTVVKEILEEQIAAAASHEKKLRTALRTHLYLSEAMQPYFYFSYMEAKNLSRREQEAAVASELYTEKIVEDIIQAGQADSVFAVRDARLTASVIKAMLQDWYLKRWKYTRRKVRVDQYAEFLEEFVLAYLQKHEIEK